jgi:hypothetical protein
MAMEAETAKRRDGRKSSRGVQRQHLGRQRWKPTKRDSWKGTTELRWIVSLSAWELLPGNIPRQEQMQVVRFLQRWQMAGALHAAFDINHNLRNMTRNNVIDSWHQVS